MILGYLQVFVKVETSDDVAYAKVEHDFRKPVTKRYFRMLKKHMKKVYIELGLEVKKVSFCTKEEYDKSGQDPIMKVGFDNA